MLRYSVSLLIRASWFVISLFFVFVCIPLALLPEKWRFDNRLYFWLTTVWSRLLLFVSGIRVEYRGLKNLPAYPEQPSILVMNHSSALDIFLMEVLAGTYPHVWMSKESYGKIPLFNILLRRMHVPVRRENPRAALRALSVLIQRVQGHARHALMFPEGTRHSDGRVHEFMVGFAMLALKLKRPVIPIYVSGLEKIFPKKRFIIDSRSTVVTIVVGQAMHPLPDESAQNFKLRVAEWYERQQEERK